VRRISHIVFSTLVLLVRCFAEDANTATPGSIRGEVVARNQNGEPAVLPEARIVLHGPVTKETQSDAKGAFAVDSLPPGTYDIEASAPGLNAALSAEASADTSSTIPVEINLSAVASTTSPRLTGLKAVDFAFSRKVYHA
jgi:hypothetical protein